MIRFVLTIRSTPKQCPGFIRYIRFHWRMWRYATTDNSRIGRRSNGERRCQFCYTMEFRKCLFDSFPSWYAISFSNCNFDLPFWTAETALQAGADGDPPFNTKKSIIFQTVIIVTLLILFIPFKGEQTRRLQDEKEAAEAKIDAFDIEHRGAAGTPDSDQGSESDTHPAFVDPYERA